MPVSFFKVTGYHAFIVPSYMGDFKFFGSSNYRSCSFFATKGTQSSLVG